MDARSGFRHREVVMFINKEMLDNGGGRDFYWTFLSKPWNEIEDELRSIIADPQVPHATKRACTWSALALNVHVVARQLEQHAYGVQRLQEQVSERETATWALTSQLQRLRREHDLLVSQLRRVREDLQLVLNDCESVRRSQLVQVERRPQEVVPVSQPQRLGYDVWPMNVDDRNKVLVEMRQRRKDVDSQKEKAQKASTMDALYMPGSTSPRAQVVEPLLPTPFPIPSSMVAPYPPPPLPTVVSGAAVAETRFPPQMPTGVICPLHMWPAVGAQKEPRPNERSREPYLINPSGHSWSQADPRMPQPQGQVATLQKLQEHRMKL